MSELKKSTKSAKNGLSDLMNRPGNQGHPILEMSISFFGRNGLTPPDYPQYDDRAMVLVFSSHLEEALEMALTTHFSVSSEEARRLFSYPDGPLADFAAKIAMAYALGIYDHRVRDDLQWVRRIRNAFAHTRFDLNFETPEIKNACAQLGFPSLTQGPKGDILPMNTRRHFTMCLGALIAMLRMDMGGRPTKLDTALIYGP